MSPTRTQTLPDFIIIGVQRGGTTSLHRYLSSHPDVRPGTEKEVHYFDNNYHRGIDWYADHFPTDLGPGELAFEASPYYLYHPAVPARMRRDLPEAKLLVSLRNPVSRAYSHYSAKFRRWKEHLSFEEALLAEDERLAGEVERVLADPEYPGNNLQGYSYLDRGHYAEQLERWFEHFPREQFMIFESEQLYRDTATVMGEILAFLGLPPAELDVDERHHKKPYAPMREETRRLLEEYYAEPNERLAQLLGRRFSWNAENG